MFLVSVVMIVYISSKNHPLVVGMSMVTVMALLFEILVYFFRIGCDDNDHTLDS